jgi:hypothetical protein
VQLCSFCAGLPYVTVLCSTAVSVPACLKLRCCAAQPFLCRPALRYGAVQHSSFCAGLPYVTVLCSTAVSVPACLTLLCCAAQQPKPGGWLFPCISRKQLNNSLKYKKAAHGLQGKNSLKASLDGGVFLTTRRLRPEAESGTKRRMHRIVRTARRRQSLALTELNGRLRASLFATGVSVG